MNALESFSKRAMYLHHYTEYMDLADIDGAAECIQDLGAEYGRLDIARGAGHSSIHRASGAIR